MPSYDPLTAELGVNSITDGNQRTPVVAALDDGGYVIVWTSEGSGGAWDVYAQRFDAHGIKVGDEIAVGASVDNNGINPDVVGLSGGGFAVVWETGSDYTNLAMRLFDASGAATGEEFIPNPVGAFEWGSEVLPAITQLADGTLFVTWTFFGRIYPDAFTYHDDELWGRRFDAAGNPLGDATLLTATTTGLQRDPAISALADGGVIIVWQHVSSDSDVYARRFDADGSPVGDAFLVNSTTAYSQSDPAVAGLADRGFVVAWRSLDPDGSSPGIYAQRYDLDGNPVGSEFRVASVAASIQHEAAPSITALGSGGFVITWPASDSNGGTEVYGRAFGPDGAAVGDQFLINSTTVGDQADVDVADIGNGRFVAVWNSVGQDGSEGGIFTRMFAPGATEGPDVLTGTEGDNIFDGLGGDDRIESLGGNDIVDGGDGHDSLDGGDGNDVLIGGAGNDSLSGGEGNDQLSGGAGHDRLYIYDYSSAGNLADLIDGGEGFDILEYNAYFSTGPITIDLLAGTGMVINVETLSFSGGDGADHVLGGMFSDGFSGGGGDDYLDGRDGSDHISGGDGNDVLVGGAGGDWLRGRTGADTLSGGDDGDLIEGDEGDDTLTGGSGNDRFSGPASDLDGDTITDFAAGDTIIIEDASLAGFSFSLIGSTLTYTGGSLTLTGFTGQLQAVAASDGGVRLVVPMVGTAGDDVLTGTDDGDVIDGLAGNDQIYDGTGDDFLYGGDGNDSLRSALGNDQLDGGAGDDHVLYIDAVAGVTVNLATGVAASSWLSAGIGVDQLIDIEWATGSSYDDKITGDANANLLFGGGGSDVIAGAAGADTLSGGNGADSFVDTAAGLDGDTIIDFLAGDRIVISNANLPGFSYSLSGNTLTYTGGSLTLTSFTGQLLASVAAEGGVQLTVAPLDGTPGSDTLTGTDGNDVINGLGGDDTLNGGNGDDTLNGGDGNDTVNGNDGNDTLSGDAGADNLRGGAGDDILNGGASGDRAWYDDALAGVTVNLATGVATSTVGTSAGIGTDQLISIEFVTGGNFDDTITGTDTVNVLRGGAGDDWIDGGGSDDWLIGDDGNDQLHGSAGEDLLGGLAGNDSLYGGADHDELYGHEGDDFLDGGTDWDIMFGGLGNDIYVFDYDFGGVSDFISEQDGDGTDEVRASLSYTLGFGLENLRLTGTAAIDGTGNQLANVISGNDAANQLSGLAGDDMLSGGGGTDVLTGGAGDDSFIDTAANLSGDTITDLAAGDRIVISNASLAGFSYSLSGNSLTYTGGTLTLTGIAGQLVASAAAGGGVELTIVPHDPSNDFNGDGRSDILWQHENGTVTNWLGQANGGMAGNLANLNVQAPDGWDIAGIGDFNGDGHDDILWQHANGVLTNWLGQANGGMAGNLANLDVQTPAGWDIAGIGDFNGDGLDDILWQHENGTVTNWLGQANGGMAGNLANLSMATPDGWDIAGIGDFNGDGLDDILWQHANGVLTNWLGQANGGMAGNLANLDVQTPAGWDIAGIGDFNGDGHDDILWQHDNGAMTNWLGQANGGMTGNLANLNVGAPAGWDIAGIGDFNGDGRDDILWQHDNGAVTDWLGQANGGMTGNLANLNMGTSAGWDIVGSTGFFV